MANAVLPEAVGPIKNRLWQARLTYISHVSGRSSPFVNQQVVTNHGGAFTSCGQRRSTSARTVIACAILHGACSLAVAGDPLRSIGGIKRRLLRRSLSVQESSFVNFVGVRVKALRELSHAARPVRFQSPFRPVASARAAKPCFFRGYFQANGDQQRLRAGGIHPGVNCACLSQRSATESASNRSLPSRSSNAMSGQ